MERIGTRRWLWAACVVVALGLPGSAAAELPELTAPRTGRSAPKDAAVVIAVEHYAELPTVEFANRDADAFVDYLRHTVGVPKARIRELRDKLVTPRAMEKALRAAASLAEPGGTLWIYFSGHGGPADKDAYLIGAAALAQPDYVDESSLRRSKLLELAESTRASRSVVLLDACYSGLSWRFAVPGAIVAVPKVAVWTATRAGQVATPLQKARHGLFSYYAIRALTGAGDTNGDGTVTFEEATTWVERAVREEQSGTGGSQAPQAVVPDAAWGWTMTEGLPVRPPEPVREVAVVVPPEPVRLPRVVPEPVAPPRVEAPRGYVRINAGRFTMGSPGGEEGHYDNEAQHEVVLTRPYWLKTMEVTQGEWRALMGNNPSSFDECGDGCPVETVSWWDGLAYCNALSLKEGLTPCYDLSGCSGTPGTKGYACPEDVRFKGLGCTGYRLPTEAEWEFAARAGTTGARYGDLDAVAWYGGNSGGNTRPVGGRSANAWGLYDMLGNVSEWTWDIYGSYPSGRVTDPEGASSGADRVLRGGSWLSDARRVRAADRSWLVPAWRNFFVGIRPARSIP